VRKWTHLRSVDLAPHVVAPDGAEAVLLGLGLVAAHGLVAPLEEVQVIVYELLLLCQQRV